MDKTYLGDGVYAENDEFGDIVLTTETGVEVTNRIVLEPEVCLQIIHWLERRVQYLRDNERAAADMDQPDCGEEP